jgi:hypothetical protein
VFTVCLQGEISAQRFLANAISVVTAELKYVVFGEGERVVPECISSSLYNINHSNVAMCLEEMSR